jgi:hypothetical protein
VVESTVQLLFELFAHLHPDPFRIRDGPGGPL